MSLQTIVAERVVNPVREVLRGNFFYGWVIVAVSFVCDMMSSGTGGYTLGLFFRSMRQDLGWSITQLTLSQSIRSVVNAVTGPVIGTLVDRIGGRPIMVVGGVVGGAGLIGMHWVHEPWQYYVLYSVFGAIGIAEFGGLVNGTVLAKWFVRKRGRAIAIATMGVSTGGWVLIPVTAVMIAHFGWRGAWVASGILILFLVTIPSALFIRNTPEEMGLRPDGEPEEPPGAGLSSQPSTPAAQRPRAMEEISWTLKEAIKTPAFWLLIPAFNLGGMGLGATLTHQIPYMELGKGFSPGTAAAIGSLMAFCAFICKPFWGFMVERIPVRWVVMWVYAGSSLGLVILINAHNVLMLVLYALVFGLHIGATPITGTVAWADYFGRASIGTIRGVAQPFMLITGIFAPLFTAWVFDTFGTYDLAFTVFIGTYGIAAVFMFFAKQPVHPSRQAKASEEAPAAAP